MDIINLLVSDIKKKKELSGIEDSIVLKLINDYFLKNKKVKDYLTVYANENTNEKHLKKNSDYKRILKRVRAELHEQYGMFQIPENSDELKQIFLKKAKLKNLEDEDYQNALGLHVSTKERRRDYHLIYEKIFKAIGKPKIILDLGCGLNPISIFYMPAKNVHYIASDIDRASLNFIQQYFNFAGIDGETMVLDLQSTQDLEKLSGIQCDACFLFKVLEIDKRMAEPIFNKVNAKFIVASFSTISLEGKIMSNSERQWFEKMLSRLNLSFSTFQTENEIFYMIKK
jgi:hypothetical protein